MSQTESYGEFDNIRPYTDEEAVEALSKVAAHPIAGKLSKFMFPDEPPGFLSDTLLKVHSVDDFQFMVMSRFVHNIMDNSMAEFSFDGIENVVGIGGNFLAISNHRDITLDPAITQVVLHENGLPPTRIAVGNNLLSDKYMEYIIRSNRMIRVIRGVNARALYESSSLLSRYIRRCIVFEKGSVWLAQREGRAKDGFDITEQGILKMLDMSGGGSFSERFKELNILPLSISYEFEPCDIKKAREKLISKDHKYVKGRYEDMESIMLGIKQPKGNVHLSFGTPLTEGEIEAASTLSKNDRYQALRRSIDRRIISGYRLWKTNYMGYDLMTGSTKYADRYSPADLEGFIAYIEHQLDSVEPELDRGELRERLLGIYGNPVISKEGVL